MATLRRLTRPVGVSIVVVLMAFVPGLMTATLVLAILSIATISWIEGDDFLRRALLAECGRIYGANARRQRNSLLLTGGLNDQRGSRMIRRCPGHVPVTCRPPKDKQAGQNHTRRLQRPGRLGNKDFRTVVPVGGATHHYCRCRHFCSLQDPELPIGLGTNCETPTNKCAVRACSQPNRSGGVLST